MKLSMWHVLVVGTLIGSLSGTAEAQKLSNSFSASVGYWKPSLEEANDALQLWADLLEDEGINPQGDDKFSGNFIFGGTFAIGLNDRTALQGELTYWKKAIAQTAREGDANASIRIIPVTASIIYYLGGLKASTRPYVGGGAGLAFTDVAVEANADFDNFKADDSGSSLLLQFLGGVEFTFAEKAAFFAEVAYVSGKFNVKERQNDVDEDVSLAGLRLKGGIRLSLGN